MSAEPEPEPAEDPPSEAAELVFGSLAAALRLVANEASVGLFFVQEHVHKSAPYVLATKGRVHETGKQAQLCKLDVDAGLETLKLVNDLGSPALQRMTADVARAQRALSSLRAAS